MHTYTTGHHRLAFAILLTPIPECDLPEDTALAFLADMRRFPLAALSCADPRAEHSAVQLWHDAAHNAFFAASIDHVLTLYTARLDAERRDLQRRRQTAERYQRARLEQHGETYAQRHAKTIAAHVADVRRQLISTQ